MAGPDQYRSTQDETSTVSLFGVPNVCRHVTEKARKFEGHLKSPFCWAPDQCVINPSRGLVR